jgi:hypothetical protein
MIAHFVYGSTPLRNVYRDQACLERRWRPDLAQFCRRGRTANVRFEIA